jgi:sedoheptulokinase
MHGVVCLDGDARIAGPLITWQDQRALEDGGFLGGLCEATGHRLAPGFGAVSLAWLMAHQALPRGTRQAGTVMDAAVTRLCGNSRLKMDATNAASWGLFDLRSGDWDWRAVKAAGIPRSLMPAILQCGATAGTLETKRAAELGLPPGIPVSVAVGDNQASMLATLRKPECELALTLGSGGQLSAVLRREAPFEWPEAGEAWEIRPFPGGRLAVVASSLAGGSAWRWLAGAVLGVLSEMGCEAVVEDEIFSRLNALGLEAWSSGGLRVAPHFLGERATPELRAAITGIDLANFRLGPLARALAWSIAGNLKSMLPAFAWAGRRSVAASGNALRRNPLLRVAAEEVFGLPLRLTEAGEEAAVGAALLAAGLDGSGGS